MLHWGEAVAGATVSKLDKALLSVSGLSGSAHQQNCICLSAVKNLSAKWKHTTENIPQQKITFVNDFGMICKVP